MNGQKIETVMTTDNKEVLKALDKLNQGLDKTVDKLNRVEDASKKAAKSSQDGFDRAGQAAVDFISGITGIGSVMGAVAAAAAAMKAEAEDMRNRAEQSRMAGMNFGQAMREMRRNFSPDEAMKDADLEKVARQVSAGTNTDAGIVAGVFSTAFSAKGKLSNEVARQAVEEALKIAPNDLAAGRTLAGRALDVAKMQAARGEKVDISGGIGFIQGIANTSRIPDLAKVGANAIPAIKNSIARGNSIEEGGELFAAFTDLMGDEEGSLAKTAQINFETRLAEFVGGTAGKDKIGKFNIPKAQVEAYRAAKNTAQRMQVLQQNPELRRKFLAETSFDASSSAVVEGLISGDQQALNALAYSRKNLAGPEGSRLLFNQKLADIQRGEFEPLVKARERGEANIQGFDLSSRRLQVLGETYQNFEETIGKIDFRGVNALRRQLLRTNLDYETQYQGKDPIDVVSRQYQEMLDDRIGRFFFAAGSGGPNQDERALLQQQLQALQALKAELEENNRLQREGNDQQQRQTIRQPQSQRTEARTPAAAAVGRAG